MGRRESARLVVERPEVRLEIDLQPFALCGPRVRGGNAHELGADPPPLVVWSDLRVEQECVVGAVPGDIHEADEHTAIVPGSDPTEAVR
jgi:hypothetical protein